MSTAPSPSPDREHSFRRIADDLRGEIVSGRYQPGDRLPSTAGLAAIRKASVSTVHKALVGLTKEGWLERINGAGTFVSRQRRPLAVCGIYQGMDTSSNEHPAFYRNLHTALLASLARRGKTSEIFVDTRPPDEQGELLPALQKALIQHRIQGLIAPTISKAGRPAFLRLTLPTSFIDRFCPAYVFPDEENLMRRSMQHFRAAGCRSVGMLSTGDTIDSPNYEMLRKCAQQEGLLVRDEWIRYPVSALSELTSDAFGYAEFMRFWKLPEKPDGLIVLPDSCMRGVIAAILELGWKSITSHLNLILHRNAHANFLCPFPALWAVSNEDQWADALVQMVEDQYEGRPVHSIAVPYDFRENVPPPADIGLA